MSNPVVTVVTGSVRRLTALIEMVKSARAAAPFGVPLSFIVVTIQEDAQTIAWCQSQADVRVIAQDGLKGAIRAFHEGAEASSADFTVLANDDLVFLPYSITVALRFLEQHPTSGGVAFADNRPAPNKHEDGTGYGVQALRVQGQDPRIYAQVGMFRTWLGNVLGWFVYIVVFIY